MKIPKKKAKQLLERMFSVSDKLNKYPMCFDTAKACALICIDEILEENKRINLEGGFPTPLTEYWQEVRKQTTQIKV